MKYAFVDNKKILSIVTTPYLHIECADDVSDDTHYFNTETNAIELKQEIQFNVVHNNLEITITGLPSGLQVTANDMYAVTDNDDLVIEFDLSGTYEIQLFGRDEYNSQTFTVDVVAGVSDGTA